MGFVFLRLDAFGLGETLLLHQARPSTDFVASLAVGHLTITADGKLAVDVQQAAVFLRAEGSASGVQTFDQMMPADDWLGTLG